MPAIHPLTKYLIALSVVASSLVSAQPQPLRRFTVRDSIRLVVFGEKPEIISSPDQRHLIVRTTTGLIESNQLESSIWLFDLKEIKEFVAGPTRTQPQAQLLVRMATSSGDDPISHIRWAGDSQSIAFLGRRESAERRLFTMNLQERQPRQLSLPSQDVTDFVWDRTVFLYTSTVETSEAQLYQSGGREIPDIQVGTGSSLEMLLYPEEGKKSLNLQPEQLWKVDEDNAQAVLNISAGVPISLTNSQALSISPDASYAIVTGYVNHVPKEWEDYEPAIANMQFAADQVNTYPKITTYRPQQYVLINLKTGELLPMLDAPVGWSAGYFQDALKVVWLDRDEVILSNTFLPLTGRMEGNRHLRPCVAAVHINTQEVKCLTEHAPINKKNRSENNPVVDIEWDPADQILLVRHSEGDIEEDKTADFFRREGKFWKKLSTPVEMPSNRGKLGSEISVTTHQGINTSPKLVARNRRTGTVREIWDPNPQLAEIKMGEASVYHWRDQAGRQWTGGLLKPPDYIKGRRYPLVIQTHGFNADEFFVDGFSTSANAARALAARDIMVLQVREISVARLTPREADVDGRDGYKAAIALLSKDGLIDPQKVGIIGWSRTGWYVLESLITAPHMFAAATLVESTHGDLTQYWFLVDYALGPVLAKSIADGVGGPPLGTGIAKWIARSPEFNTDKIVVPILFEQNDPVALIYGWNVYAALRSQNKPVELLYMRNGSHNLTKSVERLASQEMNTDWFDFWLNGHEDPDPSKVEQYKRWRVLIKREKRRRTPERSATSVQIRPEKRH
ncbi:MAG: hypothetical protein WA738_16355 [Candidatus Angelobacter sp.]